MKKLSRENWKAGIGITMLKNAISKSVLMLLMMIIATGAMSFTYDSTIIGGIDTNANTAKKTKRNLPNDREPVRKKYRKIIHVALPSTKAVLMADREMFAPFVADRNATISTTNFEKKSAVADLEMNHNFILSTLHPIAGNVEMADEHMMHNFIMMNMAKSILQNAALMRASDESMTAAFINQHFTPWFAAPGGIDALISDSEMGDVFEEENGAQSISLPVQ
ncbi:MAG: hypothetical protein ACTHLE_01250 [Agriterribacter sp.]